jgi:hypothetical protein
MDACGELAQQPHAHVVDVTGGAVGIGRVLQRACERVESQRRVRTHIAEPDVTADRDDATAPGPGNEIVRRHGCNLA